MPNEEIKVDEKAIKRLKQKIIVAESKNLRTKEKSDSEMINQIKKWIEEEAKCYSNQ